MFTPELPPAPWDKTSLRDKYRRRPVVRIVSDVVRAPIEGVPVTESGVAKLAWEAKEKIEKEEFTGGFKQLAIAQEVMESGEYELEPSDLANLGAAVESSGHAFYNYCVDGEGRELPGWRAIGLEGLGELRFQQASGLFARAFALDPCNTQAQDGLARMQRELAVPL